MLDHII
jgi:aspartyl/asparaginyl-tRNA synthetase